MDMLLLFVEANGLIFGETVYNIRFFPAAKFNLKYL